MDIYDVQSYAQQETYKQLLERLLIASHMPEINDQEKQLIESRMPRGLALAFLQDGRFYNYEAGVLESFWSTYLHKARKLLFSERASRCIRYLERQHHKEGPTLTAMLFDEKLDEIEKAIIGCPENAKCTVG
jgi:hypothetical protein